MFNQEKVCKQLLTIFKAKTTESRNTILGGIIREIRNKPTVKQGYSSKEIKAFIEHVAGNVRLMKKNEQGSYIKKEVMKLDREFRTRLGTWNFLISTENLKLHPRSFDVGDVRFFKFTPHRRKEMRTMMWRLIKNNPHYDTKWKKNYLKFYDDRLLSMIKDKTCAFVQVTGRLDKAQLIAYDKVETAIAFLKLYRSPNYDSQRRFFHVTGKVIPTTNRFTLRYSDDGQNINPLIEKIGFLFSFELDNNRIRIMRKTGFRKLDELLKKDKLTRFEMRIINSIRLFGSACDVILTKSHIRRPIGLGFPIEKESEPRTSFEAISMNDRLVRLFIALESLLILDENEPLSSNISERGAFIIGKTYDERKRIKVFIKKMYKLRSAHVHHGKSKITHALLYRFTILVRNILLNLILIKDRMKLRTEEDLRDWLERKKLS